jgi:hypothetical protein
MDMINAFSELAMPNFNILNMENIVLLPKNDDDDSNTDFWPMSLIYTIPKIIAKDMASRLGTKMDDSILRNQSAFIKTRSMHDNFMYVRDLSCRLHRCKSPTVLIKLDIAKAFDSVRWDYIWSSCIIVVSP